MERIVNGTTAAILQDLPYPEFPKLTKNVVREPYDGNLWDLTVALRKQLGPKLGTRQFSPSPPTKPKINRLMFPTPDGYVTSRDSRYQSFIIELYNELRKIKQEDTRLLVNPAFTLPYLPQVFPSAQYKVSKKILGYLESSQKAVRAMILYSLRHCQNKDIVLKMKKGTSPGYPFTFGDGITPWSSTSATVGFKGRYDDPIRVYGRNYKQVKRSWLPKLVDIQDGILSRLGDPIDGGHILNRIIGFDISVYREGGRGNSIDKVINVPEKAFTFDNCPPLYGKDRAFAFMDNNGFITTGLNDVKAYSNYCYQFTNGQVPISDPNLERYNARYGKSVLSPHRHRTISSHSFVSTSIYQPFYQMCTKGLELSKYCFPADTELVKQRVRRFFDNTKGNVMYVTGDRTNCEAFVSTNFDMFSKMLPIELKDLFNVSTYALKLDVSGPIFTRGLVSGFAGTTAMNIWAGTTEAFNMIAYICNCSYEEVMDAYISMLDNEADFMIINEISVLLFLCTDDICCIFRSTRPIRSLPDDFGVDRFMKYETSTKEMAGSFGVKVDESGLRPDPHSQVSKILFIEKVGYMSHDCWSITSRLNVVDPEVEKVVSFLLRKYFNIDATWFASHATPFLQDLKALGLTVADVVNEYSPKDQILLGQYVDMESLKDVDRFPDDITDKLIEGFLKSNNFLSDNYGKGIIK